MPDQRVRKRHTASTTHVFDFVRKTASCVLGVHTLHLKSAVMEKCLGNPKIWAGQTSRFAQLDRRNITFRREDREHISHREKKLVLPYCSTSLPPSVHCTGPPQRPHKRSPPTSAPIFVPNNPGASERNSPCRQLFGDPRATQERGNPKTTDTPERILSPRFCTSGLEMMRETASPTAFSSPARLPSPIKPPPSDP